MERSRHGKHNKEKSKRASKKRKSREHSIHQDNVNVVIKTSSKPLVEYSDVSSEDLSGPEAGEIQSGESAYSFSDDCEVGNRSIPRSNYYRHSHVNRIVEEEYYPARQTQYSPARRVHRYEPSAVSHSPASPVDRRERKHSVSSRSSLSSEIRQQRKLDSSPVLEFRQVVTSPTSFADYNSLERRKKKKKERKHKKDKKKKKKKRKHRSRSSSLDTIDSGSVTPSHKVGKKFSPHIDLDRNEPLSDWEQPAVEEPTEESPIFVDTIGTNECSPVSNDSHIASPEIEDKLRTPSPKPITPPLKRGVKDSVTPRESPHTPPLVLPKSNSNHNSFDSIENQATKELSPTEVGEPVVEVYGFKHNLSPGKSSPFRNPSPEFSNYHQGVNLPTMSPTHKRRKMDRDSNHRRHRKEKEIFRERRKISRSRSPHRRRFSRSPSWGRKQYSRSPSRTKFNKRYRSRSPRPVRERERYSRTPPLIR